MGLCVGGAEASGVYVGPTPAVAAYLGATRVWEAGGGGRSSLADYSLAELSAISADLTANGEASGHYEEFRGYLGQEYDFGTFAEGSTLAGLCESDGVPEADRRVAAQLVGILHDPVDEDGSLVGARYDDAALADAPRAGLTFLMASALPYAYQMAGAGSNVIWGASKMRSTLNSGEVYDAIPTGLRDTLVPVLKLSGRYRGYSSASGNYAVATSDRLWLASPVEMVGADACKRGSDRSYGSNNADVIPHEGSQYELFSGLGVTDDAPQALSGRHLTAGGAQIRAREGSLWANFSCLRSPHYDRSNIYWGLMSSGLVSYNNQTSRGCAVNLGFCV